MKDRINNLIDEVNRTRREPGLWDAASVLAKLDEAQRLIDQLPDGEEQAAEFERRGLYQRGLVARETGDFVGAGNAHRQAATIAPIKALRLIELAAATVEDLHRAIELSDGDLFKMGLIELAEAEDGLRDENHPEAVKWLRADIPAHRYYSHWLFSGTIDYPDSERDLRSLQTLPQALAGQYAPWVALFTAIRLLGHQNLNVLLLVDPAVKEGQHATYVCLGLLIQAKALRQMGTPGLSLQMLQRIVDYPAHGGHFVRAVARRLLAEMTA